MVSINHWWVLVYTKCKRGYYHCLKFCDFEQNLDCPCVCYCWSFPTEQILRESHVHKILVWEIKVLVFVGMFFFMIWILQVLANGALITELDRILRCPQGLHSCCGLVVSLPEWHGFLPSIRFWWNSYPSYLQQLSQRKCSLCTAALLGGSDNGFCLLS